MGIGAWMQELRYIGSGRDHANQCVFAQCRAEQEQTKVLATRVSDATEEWEKAVRSLEVSTVLSLFAWVVRLRKAKRSITAGADAYRWAPVDDGGQARS